MAEAESVAGGGAIPPGKVGGKTGLSRKKVSKSSQYSGTRAKSQKSTFTLRVVRGTHLLASDIQLEPATSDCVCFVWCGVGDAPSISACPPEGVTWSRGNYQPENPFYTTRVVYGTIDPIWEESIVMDLEEVLAASPEGADEEALLLPKDPEEALSRLLTAKCVLFLRDEDDSDGGVVVFDELGMIEMSLKDLIARGRVMKNGVALNAQPFNVEKTIGMPNLAFGVDLGTITLGATFSLEDDEVGKLLKAALGEPLFKDKQLVERMQRAAKDLPLDIPSSRPNTSDGVRASRDRGRSQSPSQRGRPSTAGSRPSGSRVSSAERSRPTLPEEAEAEAGTGEEDGLDIPPPVPEEDGAEQDGPEPEQPPAESEEEFNFPFSSRACMGEGAGEEVKAAVRAEWWTAFAGAATPEARAELAAAYAAKVAETEGQEDPELISAAASFDAEVAALTASAADGWEAAVQAKQAEKEAAAAEAKKRWDFLREARKAMLADINLDQLASALPAQLKGEAEAALAGSTPEEAEGKISALRVAWSARAEGQPSKAKAAYAAASAEFLPLAADTSEAPADSEGKGKGKGKGPATAPEVTGEDETVLLRPKQSAEPALEPTLGLGGAGSKAAMALRERDRDLLTKSLEELTRITQEGFKGLDSRLSAVERSMDKEELAAIKVPAKGAKSGQQAGARGASKENSQASSSSVASKASRGGEGVRKMKQSHSSVLRDSSEVGQPSKVELIHKTADGTICSAVLGDDGALSPNRRSQDHFSGAFSANLASPLREIRPGQGGGGGGAAAAGGVGVGCDKENPRPAPHAPLNGIFPLPAPLPATPDWGRVTLWLRGGDMVSAYCEVLDRGSPGDFGRLLAEGGIAPSALSVSVLNRACDQVSLLLLQGQGQYSEACLLFILAILREGRGAGAGTGSTLLARTKDSLVDALGVVADSPNKQGLLAGLLQTQLSR